MTALAKDTIRTQQGSGPMPGTLKAKMTTGVTFFLGSLICTDTATGYDVVGQASTTLKPLGVYMDASVTNTGADGAKEVEVVPGIFLFANSAAADAIAITERGEKCYIADDNTVAKTDGTGTRSEAGTIIDVDATGVYVCVGPYPVPGSTYATLTGIQTLTNKTLTTPTIGSFANSAHDHEDAAGGGKLTPADVLDAAVPATLGGTGQTTTTAGDVLYGAAGNTIAKLALGTARQLLKTNAGATAPEWSSVLAGLLTSAGADAVAFTLDDFAPATIVSGTHYIMTATGAASTITLPAAAPAGTFCLFSADGTLNGHTVTYNDATGPTGLTTALTASKRHLVLAFSDGAVWTALAYVGP